MFLVHHGVMKRNPWLADFRVHSTFSDGVLNIPELVDLYGQRGFGAIAITDKISDGHSLSGRAARLFNFRLSEATFPLYMAILRSEAERAWHLYRMVVIAGIEIPNVPVSRMRSVSLVGLGISSFVSGSASFIETAREFRSQGALVIAAQAKARSRLTTMRVKSASPLAGWVDAWEVTKGRHIYFDHVLRSGLPLIASSGLRKPAQLSSWKTALTCEREQSRIFEAIRRRDVSLQFYAEDECDGDTGGVFNRHLAFGGRSRRLGHVPALAALQVESGR